MVIVFKVSENTKNEMIKYYSDKKRDKTPDYAIFQAEEGGTIITLYNSLKVMFQGISADIDANMWMEKEAFLNNGIKPIINDKKQKKEKTKEEIIEEKKEYYNINSVGSDEVGTGDYFGPIIVTASYVSLNDISFLEDLGVKDSKKLTDAKIMEVAPIIIKKIPHKTIILNNIDYNNLKDKNMNRIKAVLHNKAILSLLKEKNYNFEKVVIDQFCFPRAYFNHLKDQQNVYKKISFTTKAEDKCLSVAVSSIISRYLFINEIKKISNELGVLVPFGAGMKVDELGKKIVNLYGKDILNKYTKINFKNTEKILK